MKRHKLWLPVLAVLIVILTLLSSSPAPSLAAEKLPRYEQADCKFTIPDGMKVECGYLVAKEDRQGKQAATIRIAVAVAKATAVKPKADPVVFLNGGPGGRTLQFADTILKTFRAITDTRDFILFDQRGIGQSQPALECTALSDLYKRSVNMDSNDFGSGFSFGVALSGCRADLIAGGVKLTSYNSFESAADLNELRQVLGYPTWNLFGVSYGTRLALVAMRGYRNIRSVVLDSSIPPQLKPNSDNVTNAFEILFRNCLKDTQCNKDYPRLKRAFYGMFARLSAHPVHLTVRSPADGHIYPVVVSASAAASILGGAMYSERIIPKLPRIISEAYAGDYTEIAQYIVLSRTATSEDITLGAALSIGCADSLYQLELCSLWGIKPVKDKTATQAVRSSVPTLVLAGEYDPVTPPKYGETTASTLNRSFFLQFPTMGHAPSFGTDCARAIMQAFLDAPTRKPDSSCIDHIGRTPFVPSDF